MRRENQVNTNQNNKKRNIVIAAVVGVIALGGLLIYFMNQNKEILIVKDTIMYELGETVSLEPNTFLKEPVSDNVSKDIQLTSKLLENTKAYLFDKENKTVTSKDKKYLDVGEYEVNLSYKKEKKDVKFKVEDTTAPEFIDFRTEIRIEKDAENVKLEDYFEVQDFSKTTISIDKKDFNIKKIGNYEIVVTAKDMYDNTTEKKSVVVVVVSTDDAEKNGLTETKDGKIPLSKETKKKVDKGEIKIKKSKDKIEESKKEPDTVDKESNKTSDTKKPSKTEDSKKDEETSKPSKNDSTEKPKDETSKPSTPVEKPQDKPSKPSEEKPSKPSGGNTGSTEKPKPSHTHNWVEQFTTVHHEAVYENKYVVDQAAWDEQVPITQMVERSICNGCGADITGNTTAHIKQGALEGTNCRGYHSEWISQTVGYETVHHEEVGHNEQVLVKEAWDEKVSAGYKCSCGATK